MNHKLRTNKGITSFTYGENNSPEGISKGYTHAFVMKFISQEARNTYLPHPEHETVKQEVLKLVKDVLVLDYSF